MTTTLKIDEKQYRSVRQHLLRNKVEQVAFLFAQMEQRQDSMHLLVDGIYLVPESEFDFQSAYHVSVDPDVLARMIKEASDRRGCLIEAHSHRGSTKAVSFSASDLRGFEEVVPHVKWRLPGAPYVALVFSDRDFDALVWSANEVSMSALECIEAEGAEYRPTNLTLEFLRKPHARSFY